MASLSKSDSSLLFKVKSSHLIFLSYKLTQNIYDLLDSETYEDIFQYLNQHYPILSFQIHCDFILLHLALIVPSTPDYAELYKETGEHLEYILPKSIDLQSYSSYEVFVFQDNKKAANDLVRTPSNRFVKILAFSDLEVTNYHPDILKLLLAINGIEVLFTYHRLPEPTYNMTIRLLAEDPDHCQLIETEVLTALSSSPHLSGKLHPVKAKQILSYPGRFSFGLVPEFQISPSNFSNFLRLVPSVHIKQHIVTKFSARPWIHLPEEDQVQDNLELSQNLQSWLDKYGWNFEQTSTGLQVQREGVELQIGKDQLEDGNLIFS